MISMPAGFRRHFVGKTLINVCDCDTAEIRFVGKLTQSSLASLKSRMVTFLVPAFPGCRAKDAVKRVLFSGSTFT